MPKVRIKFLTRNKGYKAWMKNKFRMPPYETINGTVEFVLKEEDEELLHKAEERNIIKILQRE